MKISLSVLLSSTCLSVPVAMAAPVASLSIDDEDTIIVTGSPLEKSVGDALLGVAVLEGDALDRVATQGLGDALRREPGMSSTAFGAGASRPIIRGQGGDRIRVLDNGIGSIDASSASPDHATAVTPATAQRIEVVRGTGLLRYGSSAAGGVVNVRDDRLPTVVPENNISGGLRLGGSSVDNGRDAAGALNWRAGAIGGADIVLHLSGTWRDAEDYDIPGFAESARLRAAEHDEEEHDEEEHGDEEELIRDTLENSFVESDSNAFGVGVVGERGFIAVGVKTTGTTYGIPAGHAHHEEEHGDEEHNEHDEEEDEEENVFIDLHQERIDLNARLNLSGPFSAVTVYAGKADYTHTEFEAVGEPGTVFVNDGWEMRAELLQQERDGWRGALGVQYRERDFEAIGDEAFVPPTRTEQTGLYTFQEIALGDWTFEGAVRFEQTDHERKTDGLAISFDGVSASAGAQYPLGNGVSAGVTAYRTERAPTTEELFSNGPHLATGQFEQGDITIDEEVATGIEGSLRFDAERGHVAINLFYTDYDGYIFERETGDVEDDLPVFQFTASDAIFSGAEIEGEWLLGRMLGGDVSGDAVLDFVNADLDTDGNLPRIPPVGATLGVTWTHPVLSVRTEIEYAGEQDEVAAFEMPTDSYTLMNLDTQWPLGGAGSDLVLTAGVNNLFDEEAREHTSFLKEEVPLPGRNVRIALRYRF